MHEVGLTLALIEQAAASAAGARVLRVVVEVGTLAAVMPDAMRFCFEVAVADTPLEGAVLEIVERPGSELILKRLEVE